jgi:hypothetical protein
MQPETFFDRRSGSVVLGLFTFFLSVHEIIRAFHGMSATAQGDPAAVLIFAGSIAPFMVGLTVTFCVCTSDKLVNMTWTSINNMFAGLLAGYGTFLFGISSVFSGSATSTLAGGIIAGIGASAAFASLIKWP